jgi:BCD family chlorophyll transporter-like MFS transporter
MGLWGAAQAVAFGLGGFLGTVAVDLTRQVVSRPVDAYALVFIGEAVLFLIGAALAARIGGSTRQEPAPAPGYGGLVARGAGG